MKQWEVECKGTGLCSPGCKGTGLRDAGGEDMGVQERGYKDGVLGDARLGAARSEGCGVQAVRMRDQGMPAVARKGAGLWDQGLRDTAHRIWDMVLEDVGIRGCGLWDLWIRSYVVRKMQGNKAARCRDRGLWGAQLRGCRIWEYGAAGCGIHDCRMRDVGTREAGYG